ncbi:GNAT family N-acetyltransferase [Spirillospora albida]|uniref:GNAT family N-acetyltransferase n=1 Tax=Spirillospora albida TaxID=58123 RepID=UPI0004C11FA0|nr:GNAT family N-acetyltransferase [Spirillospora albida]
MIRPARPDDVPAIFRLIHALAEYERAPHEVKTTEDLVRASLFGDDPKVFAHVAEHEGKAAGFAVWFVNYSTWTGRHGIYLEDLFVDPAVRGNGYGKALLTELVRIADERGYTRVEWSVLDWNSSAIAFYEAMGARPQDEWTVYRLDADAIAAVARGEKRR